MANDRPVDGFEKASFANSSAAPSGFHHAETGLTKRELFAAMILQGFAANANCHDGTASLVSGAVSMADALIEALCK
jgi:hypothetical protein